MRSLSIRLDNFGDQFTEGKIEINEIPKNRRWQLALKKLAIFWGLAIFFILVPILHFVLVPLFLFLGLYLSNKQLRQSETWTLAFANCPDCKKPIKIEKIQQKFPIKDYCPNCRHGYRIKELNDN